jgi:SDR family mycofactocin-dependent oxidoreductase
MGRLSGKVAFITGAARGQGRSHAVRLAEEGADIVASDVCAPVAGNMVSAATLEDLETTARLVEKTGQRVLSRQVDVRDLPALQKLADDAMSQLGRLDVVVANAGILAWGHAWEIPADEWKSVIDVNLTGVFYTIQATVPHLIEQGQGGSIVLISSSAGLKGQPFTLHYTAAKHGIVGICRGLANELGEYDIRVNSVHPAGVRTAMMDVPGLMNMIAEKAPTLGPIFMSTLPHEFMDPEDISATVAWLASEDARYLTGAQIPVDFGMTSR